VFQSASRYFIDQGWVADDFTAELKRRRVAPATDRALTRERIEEIIARAPSLRDKTLWTALWETSARASEILGLDIADLDLPNKSAVVTRKGGARDTVTWRTRTANLLPRLLNGRKRGPVFLTERKARVALPAADIDPDSGKARLSYTQAQGIFREASGGASLHQLRHSALTWAAEQGVDTPMLRKMSGHRSLRSLERYVRPSDQALRDMQDRLDDTGRRNGRE
jgi:integrase/recombinase XerC/integrase/recombinase XerD